MMKSRLVRCYQPAGCYFVFICSEKLLTFSLQGKVCKVSSFVVLADVYHFILLVINSSCHFAIAIYFHFQSAVESSMYTEC